MKKLNEYPKIEWGQYPSINKMNDISPIGPRSHYDLKTMASGEYVVIPAAIAEQRDRLSAAKDAVVEAAREVADETGDKGHTAPPLGSLVKLYGMLEALDKLDKVQE